MAFSFFNANIVNTTNSGFDLASLLYVNSANAETGYSCTVTSDCSNGSISCTGEVCSRGYAWVKCDGKKTTC